MPGSIWDRTSAVTSFLLTMVRRFPHRVKPSVCFPIAHVIFTRRSGLRCCTSNVHNITHRTSIYMFNYVLTVSIIINFETKPRLCEEDSSLGTISYWIGYRYFFNWKYKRIMSKYGFKILSKNIVIYSIYFYLKIILYFIIIIILYLNRID